MVVKGKKIQRAFIIYWVLLAYIIAALIWWFIALSRQNEQMSLLKLNELNTTDVLYTQKASQILKSKKAKTTQYLGEGGTFLLLIIAGAVFVFRAVRKELKTSAEQQNFMMAITHELKTPIAVAKLNLETLKKHNLPETQQQRLLSNTLQETNRLDLLCNNLLLSSQMEGGGYLANLDEQHFTSIVNDCVDGFVNRYPQRIFEKEIDEEIFIHCDTFLMQIAINNLIENAIKYSPKEKPIIIHLKKINGKAILSVIDEGAGLLEAEKEKVFIKYYRTGNEATKKAKGTGLGLYLAARICKIHHATISINNNPLGGSIFMLTLKAEA